MNCPKCNHEMTKSAVGWICLNCGESVAGKGGTAPKAAAAKPAAASPAPEPAAETPPPAEPTPATASTITMPAVTPTDDFHADVKPAVSRLSKRKIAIIAVSAVLLLGGAAAAKMWLLDPAGAPTAYVKRVIAAKTGTFKLTAEYHSADSKSAEAALVGSAVSANASGSYDIKDKKNAKADVTVNFKAGQTGLGGHIIVVPKTLYFKLTDTKILQSFGAKVGTDWYKYPLDEDSKSQCASDSSKSGTFLSLRLPSEAPVSHARRIGLFETIDGHMTSHFVGQVDFNKLQKLVDAANKDLSADCKITFSKDDYKDVIINYDLWTSGSFDRLALKVTSTGDVKGTATVTMDSTAYNKPVKITEPKDAKDIKSLFQASSSSTSSTSSSVDVKTSTTPHR